MIEQELSKLQAWLEQKGFTIDDIPINNTKAYRFSRGDSKKRNAWLFVHGITRPNHGELFYIATVGDWSTGEEHQYKSDTFNYDKDDEALIRRRLHDHKNRQLRERDKFQREVKDEAASIFASGALNGESTYLNKKKISQLHGARIDSGVVLVPMRDSSGTLWGIQKIYANGDKRFMSGQKKEGCFHTIPEVDALKEPELVLCEGFATGASIHEATGRTVVVCFDSGNLKRVAEILGKECKDTAFILAADDDRFNRDTDGNPVNPGMDAAREAAILCGGTVISPNFLHGDETSTDFNDLHCTVGLSEVTIQFKSIKIKKEFVRALGYLEDEYFYTSSENSQIIGTSAHTKDFFLSLMPLGYWRRKFTLKQEGVNWDEAISQLKEQARLKGYFDTDSIRSNGVWMDEQRVVVHLGNRLWVNGNTVGLQEFKSKNIYTYGKVSTDIALTAASLSECKELFKTIQMLSLVRNEQAYYIAGWIVSAMIGGALHWRPHLFITGESGSGKSTITNEIFKPLLNKRANFFSGGCTEPGIRQAVKKASNPVILGEFDTDNKHRMQRNESILDFFRNASGDDGEVVMGSSGGDVRRYQSRFCGAIVGIKDQINRQSDRSRFVVIEAKKVMNDPKQWDELSKRLNQITAEQGERLFRRVLDMIPVYNANISVLSDFLSAKHSQRFAQLYAPLLAGAAILVKDTELTVEEGKMMADLVDLKEERASQDFKDHEQVFNTLIYSKIKYKHGMSIIEESISLTLQKAMSAMLDPEGEAARAGLMDNGIALQDGDVLISEAHPNLHHIFKNGEFESSWRSLLRRVPNARRSFTRIWGSAVNVIRLKTDLFI